MSASICHLGSWILTAAHKSANTRAFNELVWRVCTVQSPHETAFLDEKLTKQINRTETHLHFSSTFHKPLRLLRSRRRNPTDRHKPSTENPLCHSTVWWRCPDPRWPHLSDHNRRLPVTQPVDHWHDSNRWAWAHNRHYFRYVFVRPIRRMRREEEIALQIKLVHGAVMETVRKMFETRTSTIFEFVKCIELTSLSGLCGFTICIIRFCETSIAFESPTQPTYKSISTGRYKAHKAVVPATRFWKRGENENCVFEKDQRSTAVGDLPIFLIFQWIWRQS